jgi:hypothetical protein
MGGRSASRPLNTGRLASIGALAGMLPVMAHEMHDISLGQFHAADPFSRIVIEFAGAASGVALLVATVSAIRNRIARRGTPGPMP